MVIARPTKEEDERMTEILKKFWKRQASSVLPKIHACFQIVSGHANSSKYNRFDAVIHVTIYIKNLSPQYLIFGFDASFDATFLQAIKLQKQKRL